MAQKRPVRNKCLFVTPRYWYHISTTLKNQREFMTPWDNRRAFNRNSSEPNDKRICVAPTIAHCLAAVPYAPGDKFVVYRTTRKVVAAEPREIYDAHITLEGWIQIPTLFDRLGFLSLPAFAEAMDIDIIEEAASGNHLPQCGKVLAWWKKHNLNRHLKVA